MDFKEALSVVARNDNPEFFGNSFYLYSRLSDLCGASYSDKKKIDMFFEIDKRLHIIRDIRAQGKLAVAVIKKAYPAFKDLLSKSSFDKLIDLVADIVYSDYEVKNSLPSDQNRVKKAVVEKAEEEEDEKEEKTFLTPAYGAAPYCSDTAKAITGIVISLLIIAGATCLIVFRNYISWTAWQHIIGSIGGLVLTGVCVALTVGLSALFEDVLYTDFERGVGVFGIIFTALIAGANFALMLVFKQNYSIILYWISGYLLLSGAFLIFYAFDEIEEVCGILQAVTEVITAIFLVVGIGLSLGISWTAWQYIIGSIGGLVLTGVCVALTVGLSTLFDSVFCTAFERSVGVLGVIFTALIAGANFALMLVFRQNYSIISYWVSGYLLLSGAFLIFYAFDEIEEVCGILQAVTEAIAVVFLVVGIFL